MTRITFLDGLAQSSKNLSLSFRMNHQGYIPHAKTFQRIPNVGLLPVFQGSVCRGLLSPLLQSPLFSLLWLHLLTCAFIL